MHSKKNFESLPLAKIIYTILEQGEKLSLLVFYFEIEKIVASLISSDITKE